MIDCLSRPRSTGCLLALAFLIGTLFVLVTLDPGFIAGTGVFWRSGPAASVATLDVLNNLIGYTGFVQDQWRVPLFYVEKIGAPAGTNVVFLDVIPTVALAGKVVYQLTGHLWQLYGAWLALCYVLSAVFATLLVAELGQRSLIAGAAASILAVSAPVLLFRFGHFPLSAHFLLIGGLWLYFLRDHRPRSRMVVGIWLGWLLLALLINLYLFVMAAMVYAAGLLKRSERAGWGVIGIEAAGVCGILLVTMLLGGYIGSGTGSLPTAGGFGYYSMNLASPFWPQRSGLFPSQSALITGPDGQREGFAYLGFGGLLLLAGGCLLTGRELRGLIGRHRDLVVMLTLLTLFAVSNVVYLGRIKLIDLDIGPFLNMVAGVFRSSGRMFWPAYYLMLLSGMVLLARRLPPVLQVPVLAACCILQLIDVEPLRAQLGPITTQSTRPVIDFAEWSARLDSAQAIEMHPTYLCGGSDQRAANIELQLVSIRAGRPFNSVYNARAAPDCEAETRTSRIGPWRNDTLYVYFRSEMRTDVGAWLPPGLSCHAFDRGYWCLGTEDQRP